MLLLYSATLAHFSRETQFGITWDFLCEELSFSVLFLL